MRGASRCRGDGGDRVGVAAYGRIVGALPAVWFSSLPLLKPVWLSSLSNALPGDQASSEVKFEPTWRTGAGRTRIGRALDGRRVVWGEI